MPRYNKHQSIDIPFEVKDKLHLPAELQLANKFQSKLYNAYINQIIAENKYKVQTK